MPEVEGNGNAPIPAPFPFVVGCGRSGTTLLRAMLDSHPVIAVPPESHFIPHFARRHRRYERGGALALDVLLADLAENRWFRRWGLEPAAVCAALEEAAPTDLTAGLRSLYGHYAQHQGKLRHADKTPPYVMHIPLLARLFPEAVFVHLIRDGRDVALSLMRASFGPDDFTSAVLTWRRSVQRGRAGGRGLPVGRYLELRYEDLVEDPERELRRVGRLARFAYSPSMLDYHRGAADLLAGVGSPDQHQNLRQPPRAAAHDWRSRLTSQQREEFEALAGGLRAELGYEPGVQRLRVAVRASAAGRRAAMSASHAGARAVKRLTRQG